jgi:hypothetical protein
LRIDDHHSVIANDDAGVRVAFGRMAVGVVGGLLERDDLIFEVAMRGECFAHWAGFRSSG